MQRPIGVATVNNTPSVTTFRHLTILLLGFAGLFGVINSASPQNSPPRIMVQGGKTFTASQITIGTDIPGIDTKAFTCTTIKSFKKGEKISGFFEIDPKGNNKLWSVSRHSFQIGATLVAFPMMAIVPTPNGTGHTLFAASVKAKMDIKVGDQLHLDGYQIEVARAVTAGESIPVLYIFGDNNTAVLSVEASSNGTPLFAAFTEDIKPTGRASDVETWQLAKDHVAQWAEPAKVPG